MQVEYPTLTESERQKLARLDAQLASKREDIRNLESQRMAILDKFKETYVGIIRLGQVSGGSTFPKCLKGLVAVQFKMSKDYGTECYVYPFDTDAEEDDFDSRVVPVSAIEF